MIAWTDLQWTAFGDLENGALAYVRLANDRCLIFKCNDATAGILFGPPNLTGRWFPAGAQLNCISLGADWVLDADLDEQFYPENPHLNQVGASLFYGPSGYLFRFTPHQNLADELYLPLNGGEPVVYPEANSAPIVNWSIWASERHRVVPGEGPILSTEMLHEMGP